MALARTWQGRIHSVNGYTEMYVECEGVNTERAARRVLQDRYPGAKISGIKCLGYPDQHERDREARERRLENINNAVNQTQDSINRDVTSSDSSVVSSSSSSVQSNDGGSPNVTAWVLLAVVVFGAWLAWVAAPVVGFIGGAHFGYKYSAKFTDGRNFHVRFWVVLITTISMICGGSWAGVKIHEVTHFNESPIPTFVKPQS